MTRAALFACWALIALAAPAAAQDEPRPALAEVMDGATSMASFGSGFLFVANADGGWVCAINASANHLVALRDGADVVAEQTVPGALCVPASHFKNLAE